ncbi:protein phosphatase CheZ [Tistrella mobilis]|jgi:chemotaxis protein CheZ|uniref:protein phosphatase CheZ n=1 Tax=Tistrella mobilis TaxID=171437 RepID=UPI003556AADB
MAMDETEPADDDIDWGDVGMEMPQAAPIDRIRRAVAVLRHPAASEDPLASATQALEGVVEGTEAATEAILSQIEAIETALDAVSAELSPDSQARAALDNAGMAITALYEACGFQDLTGQRIAKVRKVLQQVDAHLEELLEIVGHDQVAALPPPAEREGDARLLNGPVDDASRVSQSDIDSLFD